MTLVMTCSDCGKKDEILKANSKHWECPHCYISTVRKHLENKEGMMEWKEILDKLKSDEYIANDCVKYRNLPAFFDALKAIIQKLASEESNKPSEPVKYSSIFDTTVDITGRPFYKFKDMDGNCCHLHMHHCSNLMISFGTDDHTMYLDKKMVRALLPLLQEFVDKGEIN